VSPSPRSRHVQIAQQHVILLWTADQFQRLGTPAAAGDHKARLLKRTSPGHAHNFIIVDEK